MDANLQQALAPNFTIAAFRSGTSVGSMTGKSIFERRDENRCKLPSQAAQCLCPTAKWQCRDFSGNFEKR
jgi:hypothetical protein